MVHNSVLFLLLPFVSISSQPAVGRDNEERLSSSSSSRNIPPHGRTKRGIHNNNVAMSRFICLYLICSTMITRQLLLFIVSMFQGALLCMPMCLLSMHGSHHRGYILTVWLGVRAYVCALYVYFSVRRGWKNVIIVVESCIHIYLDIV